MMNPIGSQLTQLRHVYNEFIETSKRLDPQKRELPGVCGTWSPKELVAHLLGWDQALLTFIVDIENFTPPHDIDLFNEQSVQKRSHLTWADTLHKLDTNFTRLHQALETVNPDMQIYDRVSSWLDGRIEDYVLHQGQLAAWIE